MEHAATIHNPRRPPTWTYLSIPVKFKHPNGATSALGATRRVTCKGPGIIGVWTHPLPPPRGGGKELPKAASTFTKYIAVLFELWNQTSPKPLTLEGWPLDMLISMVKGVHAHFHQNHAIFSCHFSKFHNYFLIASTASSVLLVDLISGLCQSPLHAESASI